MRGPISIPKSLFPSLINLVNRTFRSDGIGRMEEEYAFLFDKNNRKNILVFEDQRRIAAVVSYLCEDVWIEKTRFKMALVGGVATDEQYRGQGLATRLMERAFQNCLKQSIDLMYISGTRNLYQRLGCTVCGKFYTAILKKEKTWNPRPELGIRPYHEKDFSKYLPIIETESTRIHHAPERFKQLLRKNHFEKSQQKSFTIIRKNQVAGYLVVGLSENKNEIREYAGDRKALVGVLPLLLETPDCSEVKIFISGTDRNLLNSLENKGIPFTLGPLPKGTVKVIHFGRFFKKLKPLLIKKEIRGLSLSQRQNRILLKYRDENFQKELGEGTWLTRIIFGTPEGNEWKSLPDEGLLVEAVKKIFPLSFPEYGIYYT